jgi:hypothetical protein
LFNKSKIGEVLMQYFNNVYQGVQGYWASIPENTSETIVASFITVGIIGTILTGQTSNGAIFGAVSALATAIHGLVTPLFRRIFDREKEFNWAQEATRTFTAIIGAGYIARVCGFPLIPTNLNAFTRTLTHGIVNVLFPERYGANRVNGIYILPSIVQ